MTYTHTFLYSSLIAITLFDTPQYKNSISIFVEPLIPIVASNLPMAMDKLYNVQIFSYIYIARPHHCLSRHILVCLKSKRDVSNFDGFLNINITFVSNNCIT